MAVEEAPDGDSNVCENCVGDKFVRETVASEGEHGVCDFGGNSGRCVRLSQLASILDEKYRELVRPGGHEPIFSTETDKVEYRQVGEEPAWIIQEMLECEPELADALTSYLSDAEQWMVADGDTPLYDSTTPYEFTDPTGLEYEASWRYFCERIKHLNRFFDPEAKVLLHEVFEGINDLDHGINGPLICEFNGKDDDPRIFRGRVAKDEAEARKFCLSPTRELSAPPPRLASPGRMNPAGVQMFYGATDPETCLAELRCAAGDTVVIAEFKPVRPLRLLDLSALGSILRVTSYFDSEFQRHREQVTFFEKFREEISKPIRASDVAIDYIPTQAVAEYLSMHVEPEIDGLLFRSSRIAGQTMDEIDFYESQEGPSPYPEERMNIALFQRASAIKGAFPEKGAGGSESNIDAKSDDPNGAPKENDDETFDFADMLQHDIRDPLDFTPEPPPPSLELIDDSVRIVEVDGVFVRGSYSSASYLRGKGSGEF